MEKTTGYQSVRGRGGVIAVMYETHWTDLSGLSWERKMDLQLLASKGPLCAARGAKAGVVLWDAVVVEWGAKASADLLHRGHLRNPVHSEALANRTKNVAPQSRHLAPQLFISPSQRKQVSDNENVHHRQTYGGISVSHSA